jgi:hypothetical protein
VAKKGWARARLALWGSLRAAPQDSLLGSAVRASLTLARSSNKGQKHTWAGRFVAMMRNIFAGRDPSGEVGLWTAGGTTHQFTSCCPCPAPLYGMHGTVRALYCATWSRPLVRNESPLFCCFVDFSASLAAVSKKGVATCLDGYLVGQGSMGGGQAVFRPGKSKVVAICIL